MSLKNDHNLIIWDHQLHRQIETGRGCGGRIFQTSDYEFWCFEHICLITLASSYVNDEVNECYNVHCVFPRLCCIGFLIFLRQWFLGDRRGGGKKEMSGSFYSQLSPEGRQAKQASATSRGPHRKTHTRTRTARTHTAHSRVVVSLRLQ